MYPYLFNLPATSVYMYLHGLFLVSSLKGVYKINQFYFITTIGSALSTYFFFIQRGSIYFYTQVNTTLDLIFPVPKCCVYDLNINNIEKHKGVWVLIDRKYLMDLFTLIVYVFAR